MPKFEEFLAHFKIDKSQGNTVQAHCPAHDDKKGSLSITLAGDKILVFCHAGCSVESILKAANLTFADLFLNNERKPENIYQYRNQDGSLAYEKVKYRNSDGSKEFKQRRLTGNKLSYNLDGVNRIPYNYPVVYEAIIKKETIVYFEGEKDCETAKLLGYTATTMGGASDWKDGTGKDKVNYALYFKNARLIQVPDKDKPGIGLAQKMTDNLIPVCQSLKVVILPEGKDFTEWVMTGKGRADFETLILKAPELVKKSDKPQKFDWHNAAVNHDDLLNKQLLPIGYLVEGMLVDCGTGVLAGPKKKGKSWLGLQLSQAVASGADFLGRHVKQGSVVHFALEDGERRIQKRLQQQHTVAGLPITYFYSWPAWNTLEGFVQLKSMLQEIKPALVIVDTFGKCLNGKPDQNSAGDMGDFGNRIHDLALELNLMILFIAHHGKMSTRDPGFDIRGSSAIPGATDVNVGLYKNNDDGTFELIGEGRDIEEFDIRVSLDKDITWCWRCLGDAKNAIRAETEQKIHSAIATLGGEADAAAIAVEIGTSREAVQVHLKRMREGKEATLSYKPVKDGKSTRLLYKSLTTLTTLLNNNPLQSLQRNNGLRDCKGSGTEANQNHGVNGVRDIGNNNIFMSLDDDSLDNGSEP